MTLAIAGLLSVALMGYLVWWAADRLWHLLVIAALAMLLFPLVAIQLTGDVSRYLPAGTFSDGADGMDQIVLASATATILIAIILAAFAWSAGKMAWSRFQSRKS